MLSSIRLLMLALVTAVAVVPVSVRASAVRQEQPADFEALAEAGLWDEVMNLAEQRLLDDPEDVAAVAWVGRASYEKAVALSAGDEFSRDLGRALLERAVGHLGRAVHAGGATLPSAAREWWYAARHETGADEKLVPELERAWEEGGDAYAAYLRGWIAWQELVDPDRSGAAARLPDPGVLTWLRRATDSEPQRAMYALVLAEALAATGDRAGATAAWERALAGAADTAVLLGTLLSIYPGKEHAAARLERLRSLSKAEEERSQTLAWALAHALDQLGLGLQAEQAFAEVTATMEQRSADFDRAHAILLIRLDRHLEAVALMQPRAAQRDWEAFAVLLDIADSLGLERRWDEALAVYDAAIAVEARDERAARNRAITLWRAGRHELARAAWDDVIRLLPARADLLNDAALSAAGAGDPLAERVLLEAAVALPGSLDAHENLAAWHLGQPSGQRSEAVRLLEIVLAEEPDRDRALYLRFRAGRPR